MVTSRQIERLFVSEGLVPCVVRVLHDVEILEVLPETPEITVGSGTIRRTARSMRSKCVINAL